MLNHNRPKVANQGTPAGTAAKPKHEDEVTRLRETKLTPTEELIMEVLGARERLGEPFWPFSSRLGPAIRSLSDKGFVDYQSGNVENTIRVSYLNQAAKDATMSATYVPPILAKVEAAEALKRATEQAQEAVRVLTENTGQQVKKAKDKVKAKAKKAKKKAKAVAKKAEAGKTD